MQFFAPYSLLLHKLKLLSSDAEQYMVNGRLTIKVTMETLCVNACSGESLYIALQEAIYGCVWIMADWR